MQWRWKSWTQLVSHCIFKRPLFPANFSTPVSYHAYVMVETISTHVGKTSFMVTKTKTSRLSWEILDESEHRASILPKYPAVQTWKSQKQKIHLGQSAVVWSVQKHKPHYHFVMSNKEKSDNMFKGHGESSIKTYKRVVSEWIWSRTKIREDLGTS